MNTQQTHRLVTLRGSTARLRQLMREHGDMWVEMDRREVPCFNGRVGVWVQSLDRAHSRWVELTELED